MRRYIKIVFLLIALYQISTAQVYINDFLVNDASKNTAGLQFPQIAAHSNGDFAIGWNDLNDYLNTGQVWRIAVQRFNAQGNTVGQLNLFEGESRTNFIWTDDFVENVHLAFQPGGVLLVAMEHEGYLLIGPSSVWTMECGLGAIANNGQIIDMESNEPGVVHWLLSTELSTRTLPRIAMNPDGSFLYLMNGEPYNSDYLAVAVELFNADGTSTGEVITPHTGDYPPQHNHTYGDVATNGTNAVVVWQSTMQDANWDVWAQFYNANGPIGNNIKVNAGDNLGTFNLWPSVAMNAAGKVVVVWADTRDGMAGDIYGQLFTASGQKIGNNFKISAGQGEIYFRPEVAMRSDGSFMVVWTDSSGVPGNFRARGRQYDATGAPINTPFVIPNIDVASGMVDVATDGSAYYLTWLDDRLNQSEANLFAKKIGNVVTALKKSEVLSGLPGSVQLFPAFPNPFNPVTIISYSIPRRGQVTIRIFNTLGERVFTLVSAQQSAGVHQVQWNGRTQEGVIVPSGIYYIQLEYAGQNRTREIHHQKIVLAR